MSKPQKVSFTYAFLSLCGAMYSVCIGFSAGVFVLMTATCLWYGNGMYIRALDWVEKSFRTD